MGRREDRLRSLTSGDNGHNRKESIIKIRLTQTNATRLLTGARVLGVKPDDLANVMFSVAYMLMAKNYIDISAIADHGDLLGGMIDVKPNCPPCDCESDAA